MPEHLVFTLAAPIASFGVGAGNFSRGSEPSPGHSLVVGLLGAALGLVREDERLLAMSEGLRVAVAMEGRGAVLRDFHTVQSRKEWRGARPLTRKQALEEDEPYTTISERDYFCDVRARVALRCEGGPFSLQAMAEALAAPRFTLYLGRKSCPLALPPAPEVIEAESADMAIDLHRARMSKRDLLFPVLYTGRSVRADTRLYPAGPLKRRSRRRTAPGARSVWSYRLLEELTLETPGDTP